MRPVLLRRCHRLLNSNCNSSIRLFNPALKPLTRLPLAHNVYKPRSLSSISHTLQQHDSLLPSEDTIFALSSASGRAAIAIIRISGPACVAIYHALCPSKPLPKPRYAVVRSLYAPSKEETILHHEPTTTLHNLNVLDSQALVLFFPSPKTVTGEDILELHVHGGLATVKAVLQAIPKCSTPSTTIRYAEAGEFTRRAFMNDRMDLTQVEALGDVLAASTEQQRRLSIRATTGTLARTYEAWRTRLLYARGELEALIDFSEDQHFDESPAVLAQSVAKQVQELEQKIGTHISNAVRGELLRTGISIALLGAPNAGKSSLLNRIVGREAAIVSREAGTTRDVVEVGIDLGGYLCRVGDMAGLRTNNTDVGEGALIGIVEEEGIKRAKARALESDVVIVVFHIERISDTEARIVVDEEVMETAKQCLDKGIKVMVVVNKRDLLANSTPVSVSKLHDTFRNTVVEDCHVFFISCKEFTSTDLEQRERTIGKATKAREGYVDQVEGDARPDASGIANLLESMIRAFGEMTSALSLEGDSTDASVWQESLGASERHRLLLQECLNHLQRFLAEVPLSSHAGGQLDGHLEAASRAEDLYVLADHHQGEGKEYGSEGDDDVDVVLAAESLRAAADCLARITGRGVAGDVEEVLGVVFEKFCVGK